MIATESDFTVLVVEENIRDYGLIKDYLSEGFASPAVSQAKSVALAQKYLQNNQGTDVVILDLTPGDTLDTDGIISLGQRAPVILLVDQSRRSAGLEALSNGASDFLIKQELTPSLLHKSVVQSVAREKHLRKLRESEENYRNLFEFSPQPKWIYDIASLRFVSVNQAAINLYGYSRAEFMDMSILDIRPPQDIPLVKKALVELETKAYAKGFFRHLKKNGQLIDVQVESTEMDFEGRRSRLVLSVDITEKLIAERAVKWQETILGFEKEIYELNANPKVSFDFVIEKLIANVEHLLPGSFCSIVSLKDDNTVSHLGGRPIDDNYVADLKNVTIGPKAGSWGTALYTGKSIFVSDIQNDPLWDGLLHTVEPYGFKSCWSIPVKKRSGKIIAAFAVYFKVNRKPSKDETNLLERATNLVGVLIENHNAVAETESAKERYDIVAKATSDTIWDWKIQEDDFLWNKGIQGVFGYKKEDVGKTSKWWFDRIHPEDSIKMSVKLYSFLEQKTEKWQDEYRFACADGTYKYVLDRGFLVKDVNGKAIRMIGAMQDITKQKEEEQRLKLLETVITETKDAVVITESEKRSGSIPKIVFVNPAFTQMTGYKSSEVVGRSPASFMGKRSIADDISKLSDALKNKKEFKFETLNHKKNGEEYWVNFSMIPITNKEGQHSHWISIQRDITEEKRQEKEKEQLIRELTQNNKDLKQFSYITSHNLRAPLSNLTGLLNLIEDIPIENPELKEILNGFSKSTHLLNETINDLVKVVIIKDNPSIQREEVLIQDVFENVFNQLSFLISLHKPIIKIELGKTSILNINKAYLESILLNLLTNAIKYRATGRQLKIHVRSREVGNNVMLTFKDNGIGIDMKRNADKIFGLYQRFHNYPDSKGLGLYLVKSQVETMGGAITVQSEVDKGTTFTLTFKNYK
jgi:PAS domain S-box-containing protein